MAYQKGTGRPHHLVLSTNAHSMKQEIHLHSPCSRTRPYIKHTLTRTSQPIHPQRQSSSSGTYFWFWYGRAVQRVRLFTIQDKVKQMAGMLVSASWSLTFSPMAYPAFKVSYCCSSEGPLLSRSVLPTSSLWDYAPIIISQGRVSVAISQTCHRENHDGCSHFLPLIIRPLYIEDATDVVSLNRPFQCSFFLQIANSRKIVAIFKSRVSVLVDLERPY